MKNKGRTFTIGDIHGAYRALLQVLKRSNFDYKNDKLICLGDIADGWSEVSKCVDELLKIKYLISLCGNHDKWFLDWMRNGFVPIIWTENGGVASMDDYIRTGKLLDKEHQLFWRNLDKSLYHIEDDKLFLHGGYDWKLPLDEQPTMRNHDYSSIYWDRHLWETAVMYEKRKKSNITQEREWSKNLPKFTEQFKEIYIGHTSTSYSNPDMKPVNALNVWNLDTGAGWNGKLTIMDVDTKEYWQSDKVSTLYPEEKGRG